MKLTDFNNLCASLPATEKVVQWGGSHVWKVGGKIFALASKWGDDVPGETEPFRICFKCSELSWDILKQQPNIVPAPYLGRAKWVMIKKQSALNDENISAYVEAAHAQVSAKLTRKVRAELGL